MFHHRILQGARAIDKDQQGAYATVEYQVLKGPFSDYVAFVSPLEGTLVLKKSLDYESLKNFTVTLRAQDQGTPPKYSDTTLRVIVEDADDQNPKFLRDSYRAELLPDGRIGELKIQPEPMKAIDQVIFSEFLPVKIPLQTEQILISFKGRRIEGTCSVHLNSITRIETFCNQFTNWHNKYRDATSFG